MLNSVLIWSESFLMEEYTLQSQLPHKSLPLDWDFTLIICHHIGTQTSHTKEFSWWMVLLKPIVTFPMELPRTSLCVFDQLCNNLWSISNNSHSSKWLFIRSLIYNVNSSWLECDLKDLDTQFCHPSPWFDFFCSRTLYCIPKS